MKKITTFIFLLLFALTLQGQTVITNDGKVITAYDANTPLNINTTCEVWLDGDDASTFTLDGTSVDDWTGKGALGITVSNGNADATRPTYDASTGKVTFTAASTQYLQSANFASDLEQPNTIFVVYNLTGDLSGEDYIFSGKASNRWELFNIRDSKFRIYSGVPIDGGATNANDNIHCGLFNGASSEYWINGASVGSGDAGTRDLDGITLGANGTLSGKWADCEIGEVIVYNADISDADHDKVTGYLANKWDITATTDFKGYVLTSDLVNLHFFIGQSNQAGRVTMNNLPVDLEGDIADIMSYTTSGFEVLNASETNNNQHPNQTDQYGYMVQFLDTLKNKQNDIYCTKYAVGGTALAEVGDEDDWNINSDELFSSAMTFINSSISSLNAFGYKPKIYIHWYQGESDMDIEARANAYETNFRNLVDSTNDYLETLDIHSIQGWYICLPSRFTDVEKPTYYATVRTAIQTVADEFDYSTFETEDLPHMAGVNFHLDADGITDLKTLIYKQFETEMMWLILLLIPNVRRKEFELKIAA